MPIISQEMPIFRFILKWIFKKKYWKWYLLLLLHCSIVTLQAATRYWIATSTGNCNNSANWSATSGGVGGASVPTSLDNVVFDGAGGSNGNCIINVNASITNLTITAGYSGSLIQNSGITFIINGNSIWSGGTFSGGNSGITNVGAMTISGTQFISTSGTLIVRGNFTFSSGNFLHNNGTVDFQTNSFSINGSPLFYNVKNTPSYNTLTINSSFSVANNFTLSGSGATAVINTAIGVIITVNGNLYKVGDNFIQYNNGTIDVKGNVIVTNTAYGGGGTGTISITGTGTQAFSSVAAAQYGRMPAITINKPSGSLSLSGTLTVGGGWNYVSGSLDVVGSTLYLFNEPGGAYISISGTHSLNNVVLYPYYSTTPISGNLTVNNFTIDGSSSSALTLNNTVTINNNLSLTGSDIIRINGGLMDVKGDILINNTNVNGGGSGTVQISGTGNQVISNPGALSTGKLPNVFINKSSGTLSLSGTISTTGPNWTYMNGGFDAGSSTVYFYREPGGSNIVVSGTHTLNNVAISSYYSSATFNNNLTVNNFSIDASTSHALSFNSQLNVNGVFSTNGSDVLSLNTGTIHVKGNINHLNTNNGSGGTAVFNISGTSNQSITGTGIVNQSKLPANVNINKPSGNLVIAGGVPFYIYNTLNFIQGTIITSSNQNLIFAAGSAVGGTPNNGSYIDGPVRKIGNTAFTFPIGKNGYYAPVSISAPANVSHAFTAEYFLADPNSSYNVSLIDPTLHHVSRCEYWDLQRTTGASNVSVTVSWDSPRSCGVTNLSDLRVAHWDPNIPTPMWKDLGSGTVTGNTNSGSIRTNSLVSSFSPFTLASISGFNPLPVTLASFEGKCIHNHVELNWVTATEINNDYFEIEKSNSGLMWQTLKKIKAAGNTTVNHYYSTHDSAVHTGYNYYRLKQVDVGGNATKISQVILIENCESASKNIAYYPNPVKDKLFINSACEWDYDILIKDITGRPVFSKRFHEGCAEINMNSLENGSYIVTCDTGTNIKSFPIVLNKD